MKQFPAIFELNDNEESNGVVHLYCCGQCRTADVQDGTVEEPFISSSSHCSDRNNVCERCNRRLNTHPVSAIQCCIDYIAYQNGKNICLDDITSAMKIAIEIDKANEEMLAAIRTGELGTAKGLLLRMRDRFGETPETAAGDAKIARAKSLFEDTAKEGETLDALQLCFRLLDNSDVRFHIGNTMGNQAELHEALNTARPLLRNGPR